VLVKRYDQSLLRAPRREPAQREVESVPAHDHRLIAAPRLDLKASHFLLRQIGVERRHARIGCPRRSSSLERHS
jgi:hypothetical protein